VVPRAVAAALVLSLALAGCTPDAASSVSPSPSAPASSVTPVPTTAGPSQTPVVSGPQTNPRPSGQVADGGALRLAVSGWPTDWNLADSTDSVAQMAAGWLSPQLLTVDAAGATHWNPDWLAGSPTLLKSDPTTVAYRLNPAAVWSDGTPLALADFVATWQACRGSELARCSGEGFDHIASLTEPSPGTIQITYDQAWADWGTTFASGLVRADSTGSADASVWSGLAGHLGQTAGPFRYATSTDTTVTFERNPLWWGEPPKLDTIELVVVPQDQLAVAYQRGDIDAAWIDQANAYAQLQGTADIQLRVAPGPTSRWLAFNTVSGPLSQVTVRQALLRGLDRLTIAQADLAGLIWSQQTLDNPVFRADQAGYANLTKTTATSLDLAAANSALDQAGYQLADDGQRYRDGQPLVLTFLLAQGDGLAENEAFNVRAQLRALGVELELVYDDPATLADDVAAGRYDLTASSLTNPSPLAAAQRLAGPNQWGYDDPVVDSLVARAASQFDDTARAAALAAVALNGWLDAGLLPLYQVPQVLLTRPTLANYGPDGLATTQWPDVGWVE